MSSSTRAIAGSPESRAVAAERMTFFTDAVLAIAMTLLALDLPVPEGATNAEVLHSFGEHRGEYMAFLISFLVIAAHWRSHHGLYRYVGSMTPRLSGLNTAWLLTQVVTPFATKVITGESAFETRFIFYAVVQTLAGGLFLLMLRQIRRHRLYRDDTPPEVLTDVGTGALAMALAFVVSIPAALFTHWAYLCWAALPLADSVLRGLRRHRTASPA
ncbi:TMEM175 family protein [Actinokineospora sp. NBRC 105648]|uniref:TMEM175 family protein n=1 Tax=Actinokineospora sp. NBRC 105648 TaxID=3032206 RepID=UPI0025553C90|nr:TMEM175 family protein [Actinokineospora sp. NBRC 105648]